MTFSHINTDTATAATTFLTLALYRTEIHADRGVDGKAFGETLLTVCGDHFLSSLRENDIGNQPDTCGTLDTVERNEVEQLNQSSVAILATGHIAVAGTFVGGEYRRDGVQRGTARLDNRHIILALSTSSCGCTLGRERQNILAHRSPVLTHLNNSCSRTLANRRIDIRQTFRSCYRPLARHVDEGSVLPIGGACIHDALPRGSEDGKRSIALVASTLVAYHILTTGACCRERGNKHQYRVS